MLAMRFDGYVAENSLFILKTYHQAISYQHTRMPTEIGRIYSLAMTF